MSVFMSKTPLNILKAGLAKLKKGVGECRKNILACLRRKENISNEEEQWLDNEANYMEEDTVVDLLDKASDYQHGVSRLTTQQKIVVKKLMELGSGIKKIAGNKRKHMASLLLCSKN